MIVYIRRARTQRSSLHAAPVTGSLVFSAPVYCLAVYCAAGFYSWLLFGGTDCVWLARRGLFFRQARVDLFMVTDGAAVVVGRAGITFGVELVIPRVLSWSFPEKLWLTSSQKAWRTWGRSRTLFAWLVGG